MIERGQRTRLDSTKIRFVIDRPPKYRGVFFFSSFSGMLLFEQIHYGRIGPFITNSQNLSNTPHASSKVLHFAFMTSPSALCYDLRYPSCPTASSFVATMALVVSSLRPCATFLPTCLQGRTQPSAPFAMTFAGHHTRTSLTYRLPSLLPSQVSYYLSPLSSQARVVSIDSQTAIHQVPPRYLPHH